MKNPVRYRTCSMCDFSLDFTSDPNVPSTSSLSYADSRSLLLPLQLSHPNLLCLRSSTSLSSSNYANPLPRSAARPVTRAMSAWYDNDSEGDEYDDDDDLI